MLSLFFIFWDIHQILMILKIILNKISWLKLFIIKHRLKIKDKLIEKRYKDFFI